MPQDSIGIATHYAKPKLFLILIVIHIFGPKQPFCCSLEPDVSEDLSRLLNETDSPSSDSCLASRVLIEFIVFYI